MAYRVWMKRKLVTGLTRMPLRIQKKLGELVETLVAQGPIVAQWPNFSSLGEDDYHCHLSYSWVACWRTLENDQTIEVYYVGSRENAPY